MDLPPLANFLILFADTIRKKVIPPAVFTKKVFTKKEMIDGIKTTAPVYLCVAIAMMGVGYELMTNPSIDPIRGWIVVLLMVVAFAISVSHDFHYAQRGGYSMFFRTPNEVRKDGV